MLTSLAVTANIVMLEVLNFGTKDCLFKRLFNNIVILPQKKEKSTIKRYFCFGAGVFCQNHIQSARNKGSQN